MSDIPWENLWTRFWWLRGFFAAFVSLNFFSSLFDFSQIELLRAFHAVIVQWNEIAAWIGGLMGKLPYIPEFQPNTVNAAVFAMTFGVPAKFNEYFEEDRINTLKRVESMSFRNHILIFMNKYLYLIHFNKYLYFLIVNAGYFGLYLAITKGNLHNFGFLGSILLILSVFTLFMLTYLSAFSLKNFRLGFFYSITFVIFLELMYFARVPAVQNWVLESSCSALQVPLQDCIDD